MGIILRPTQQTLRIKPCFSTLHFRKPCKVLLSTQSTRYNIAPGPRRGHVRQLARLQKNRDLSYVHNPSSSTPGRATRTLLHIIQDIPTCACACARPCRDGERGRSWKDAKLHRLFHKHPAGLPRAPRPATIDSLRGSSRSWLPFSLETSAPAFPREYSAQPWILFYWQVEKSIPQDLHPHRRVIVS